MAASTVEESPVSFPPDEVVGNAFAKQYYMILERSPSLVYRFYVEASKLGRPENGGSMSPTTTMDAINEKIQSYGSSKADIKFVDAQASYNGGVIVLITGSMINPDNSRRAFTQTFFLAPQEKGYFVLNDIFRYVDDDFRHIEHHGDGMAPTTPSEGEALPVQENHDSEQSNGEVYNPSENGEVLVEEGKVEEEEEPVAEVIDETPKESEVVIESNDKIEEPPKRSYASIVMKDSPATASFSNLQKSVPKMQDRQVDVPPAPSLSVTEAPSSSSDMVDYENNQEQKGDGHSIYLRSLPFNVSYTAIEEEFKRFGPIKSDGIQILFNKGFCFGFVEFEEAGAARSAIQASPIIIGGREVGVEEKKSTATRGNSRGRYPVGRGGGYRGEWSRGRGGYGGGRGYGYGRGERNNYNFSNKGGGNRGYEYSGGEEEYGGGHIHRGGGPRFGVARAQRIHAQS